MVTTVIGAATTSFRACFTGKERDAETGLDYFGARYMSGAQGRFMSPDDFFKDSHVGDPQSWNKYAYVRNNPMRHVDPTGENATVSTTCTTDADGKKTCQVNVTASIAIYAQDSDVKTGKLGDVAQKITSDINNAWSGTFTQDGVNYNVSTSVTYAYDGVNRLTMAVENGSGAIAGSTC